MKLTKEMQDDIMAWVEKNGLFPQRCGAPIADLCRQFGFSRDAFELWRKKSAFSVELHRAQEVFAAQTEVNIVNALVRAAGGVDFTREKQEATAQKVVEYDPKTGKKIKEYTTDKLVAKKATKETIYYPPNVDAVRFLLTNLAADRWRLKQEVTHQGGESPVNITLRDPKAQAGLLKAISTGAAPRKPKDEE